MKIAIIGTRGIPNAYGGFEQFAEYLSQFLCKKGHDVTVYNSSNHPYKESRWQGVNIVHAFDPENKIGTVGQFVYDLFCILNTRSKKYDIILQLGYTSSSIWGFLFKKNTMVYTNMDGLEWKRSKYSKYVQRFLKVAEYYGIKYSDVIISDSIGIKSYLDKKYKLTSHYIPYGAEVFKSPNIEILQTYELSPKGYDMLIARLEPENNIEVILDGFAKSKVDRKMLVVGNFKTKYGKYLSDKFLSEKRIKFLGTIYDIKVLNNLRYYSNLYFHGHSVGGTNPSLLEAMASNALICAHKNTFNEAILNEQAFYFLDSNEVTKQVESISKDKYETFIDKNIQKISTLYSWDKINNDYERLFKNGVVGN